MATHSADIVDINAHEAVTYGKFVKVVVGGVDLGDTLGERTDGIAFNDAAAGSPVGVQVGKIVKVKVGATPVLDAASLTTDANGLAITAVTGDYVRCKALEAGAAGAVISALWFDGYVFDGT